LGLIGPASLWKPLQTRLHKNLIPAPEPEGWNNQIRNDVILSYKLGFEKNLVATKSFLLNGIAEATAGTLNDKLSGGLSIMVGKLNNPFQASQIVSAKKRELYFFAQSFVSAVGYDATLQGGVFNRKSPYTISASNMKRFTFQGQLGVMLKIKKFYLELADSYLSKEFKTGKSHKWGSLGVAFELK
jgi:hypothetical protein